MNDWAGGFSGTFVTLDEDLEREFEDRLRESTTLAFRVAYGVLRHRQDAEDVAQEAFAKAYRSFTQLRDRERFRAWLMRMTWRLAIDRWRSDRRRTAREQAVKSGEEPSTEEIAVSRERAERLWKAIDTLPEKLRIVVVLGAIEGHDIRTLARLLNLPEGTVKSRLYLARKGLAESLRCLAPSD
ncbi:MAG TPA: RNA polymerase sigma factor [Vicinamibacterales bacterium]|nr:RNA polymerase sigma factor [Vicinamibacterales bacterium]